MSFEHRRQLLRSSVLGGLAVAGAGPLVAAFGHTRPSPGSLRWPRELWITRPQAQEAVRAVYWADGTLQPDGYRAINRIYRDLQAGVERPIVLDLLNLNYLIQCAVARRWSPRPMVLLSGFRTPQTNRRVGAVEMDARLDAADDYIYAGLSFQDNLQLARQFQVGGLGVYPDRGSLHKDVGPSRTWVQYGRGAAGQPPRVGP